MPPSKSHRIRQLAWLGTMAWRDSRGSRARLLLAVVAIAVGIAAFSAITAFEANVREAVYAQAKAMLGADLVLSSRQPFAPETEALLDSLGGAQSREIRSASMAYFPASGVARLVQVRALEGDFPYYGTLETVPPDAAADLRHGVHAVVDEGLLLQVEAQVGDTLTIGSVTLTITGRLTKIPGESLTASLLSPRVYLSMAALQQAEILQKGSVVTYKAHLKLPPGVDADALLETLQPHLNAHRLSGDTPSKRAASVGRIMSNLTHFLHLVGFIAVLLGGLGVAGAMHAYIAEKLPTVAMLRCLGVRPRQAVAIYLLQALGIGALGAGLGGVGGVLVHTALPLVLQTFLPVSLVPAIAWLAVLRSLAIGVGMVLLFALVPLMAVRRVTPLAALRTAAAALEPARRDPWRWAVAGLIVGGIVLFALTHTARWMDGAIFCAGLGAACGLLLVVAYGLMALVQWCASPTWPYVWRQGLANLYRPRNQTRMVILVLGVGTFLLSTLYLAQHTVLRQVAQAEAAAQPNLILFDIQSDQRQDVAALLEAQGLTVQQQVPFVTMRLASLKGQSTAALRADPGNKIPEWALLWEYRVTYREYLLETETVSAGTWEGHVASPDDTVVPVSLEEDLARTLHLSLGDALEFDVQGVPIPARVRSLRRIDWQRFQPHTLIVFPAGVLEQAPQFHVLVTRVPTPALLATVQRTVVQHFPNVSLIDLTLIRHTVDAVVQKIAFAVRFMALFSMAAGTLVLISAVVTSRVQRLRESVLLRTLGATRRQIRQILVIEYLFLGGFAALTGVVLAVPAAWALARFLFGAPFVLTGLPLLLTLVAVIALTVLTGLLGSRGVTTHPPLAVLRQEL